MNNYDSTCRENRTTDLVSHLSVMHQPNEVRFNQISVMHQPNEVRFYSTRKLDFDDASTERGTILRVVKIIPQNS